MSEIGPHLARESAGSTGAADEGLTEMIDTAERTLDRLLSWIRGIDAKAGFVFSIDIAMLGVLAAAAPPPAETWGSSHVVSATLTSVGLVVSLACIAASVFPFLSSPNRSIVFFGGIARMGADEFGERFRGISRGEYLEDLIAQCHRNGEIAAKKYQLLRGSMLGTYAALLPWMAVIALLYRAPTS